MSPLERYARLDCMMETLSSQHVALQCIHSYNDQEQESINSALDHLMEVLGALSHAKGIARHLSPKDKEMESEVPF